MGIVIRQSFWSTIFLFLGVFLGAINILFLFRSIIGDEFFGLTRILLSVGFISAEFAVLGTPTMIIKYFPFFKEEKNKGIVLYTFLISCIGTILAALALYLFKEPIISAKEGDAGLIGQYYFVSIIILVGVALYKFFHGYFNAILKTTVPTFLNELMLRVYITLWLLAYHFFEIEIYDWLLVFGLIYTINPLVMIIYLKAKGVFDLSWNKKLDRPFIFTSLNFGLWNLLAGASVSLVNNVDIFMVGLLLSNGEEKAGFYAIALYIVSLIVIPTRAMTNVTHPLVARMFKDQNFAGLKKIYAQSSINLLVVCGLLFVLIWINVDNIFLILGDDPEMGKWVVLFVGLSKLFAVATGVNGALINHSPHFRYTTYFILILAIITIASNLIFIPRYEILGAAAATAFSLAMFNFLKWLFVWVKLKMQPFDIRSIKALIVGLVCIGVSYIIPEFFSENLTGRLLDIGLRSLICGGVFISMTLWLGLSDEIDRIVSLLKSKIAK
ncbi:MAG: hypothetical protein HKN39_04610 [Flavobacteriales bacterium]|nr:hypothetical protein [Flavobacteriales bacterium]